MFFGGGERANARTPSQTLRVARGPSDVRPVCGWGVGGMGPQTVSIPSLSGDGVPTIGLTNGRVNRNARHTQIVLWFIQRLLPEGLTQSSHKRHPKVHFSGDGYVSITFHKKCEAGTRSDRLAIVPLQHL
jgi:hypothetical protein